MSSKGPKKAEPAQFTQAPLSLILHQIRIHSERDYRIMHEEKAAVLGHGSIGRRTQDS